MKRDPPLRKDGRCARPGCGKKIVISRNPKVTNQALMIDPFCSAVCAMAYHGVVHASAKVME